jgi:hypothetical protein
MVDQGCAEFVVVVGNAKLVNPSVGAGWGNDLKLAPARQASAATGVVVSLLGSKLVPLHTTSTMSEVHLPVFHVACAPWCWLLQVLLGRDAPGQQFSHP